MVGIETFGCDECLIQQTSARQVDFFSDGKIDFSPYFESHSFSISESDSLPNVYFIILDGYPRNDILEKHLTTLENRTLKVSVMATKKLVKV